MHNVTALLTYFYVEYIGVGHRLVFLPDRCSFIERLMWSLVVIGMDERRKLLADAPSTVPPRRMEVVNSRLERVKLLFDMVSVGVVEPVVQSWSKRVRSW